MGAGGTELIGKTTLDLEDRFYSHCYATCGLPTKFELDGYNRWRDCMLPHHLLARMCKKYGLKKPNYFSGKVVVYDLDNNAHEYFSNLADYEKEYNAEEKIEEENEELREGQEKKRLSFGQKIDKCQEQLALDVLNDWQKITKVFIYYFISLLSKY